MFAQQFLHLAAELPVNMMHWPRWRKSPITSTVLIAAGLHKLLLAELPHRKEAVEISGGFASGTTNVQAHAAGGACSIPSHYYTRPYRLIPET